jgi:hypothetical protein
MPENTLPSNERTVVVNQSRFGILTIVSLCFNALILLLLLIGLVCHHHHRHQKHEEFGRDRDRNGDEGGRDGMRFHRHEFGQGGQDWDRGPGREEGGHGWGQGPDKQDGGPGEFHGRPGFGGPGGMNHKQPPTATEMTDHIMQHLTKALTLTDQENTQIRPVVEAQVADLQKDMEAQRQARMKSIEEQKMEAKPDDQTPADQAKPKE